MGDEFLELECKLLKATLNRMMRINEAYQLKSMFTHAVNRLELIFRIRYKKLLEREMHKETIELINTYCKNDDAAIQAIYFDTDSIKEEREVNKNE